MIGELIGNFRVQRRIGEGGMGAVYLANHESIDTTVAVKVLLPHVSSLKDHVQRFFNEARAVSKIKHAGIVRIYDVGFHAGQAYLIMELLEGESLAAMIQRVGRVPMEQLGEIGRQIASVLGATHAAGITHRDLKPDNIFLVPDHELASGTRVKVLDFGIAKLTGTIAMGSPRTMGTMGTPAYMAPEQWADSASVDARTDVYSLGCVLFEMACGRPPFPAQTIAEACTQHLTQTPPPARSVVPALPGELDSLLARMLAKSPDARPTLAEVSATLGALAGAPAAPMRASAGPLAATVVANHSVASGAALTTLGGASGQRQTSARGDRGRRLAIGIGVAGVALGAVILLAVTRGGGSASPTPAEAPVEEAVGDAAAPVDGAPDALPRTLAETIESSNPFVAWRGVRVQRRQVSRAEYAAWLASLSAAERAAAAPRQDWPGDGELAGPVAWVTHEDAAAFCAAIGAALPTSEQWSALSGGDWGLDPNVDGEPGPLQEWTSTVEEGLAVVRGGHARMNAAARAEAATEPLYKSTETFGGPDASAATVAGATIGFRCVK